MKISRGRIYKILLSRSQTKKHKPKKHLGKRKYKKSRTYNKKKKNTHIRYKSLKHNRKRARKGGARLTSLNKNSSHKNEVMKASEIWENALENYLSKLNSEGYYSKETEDMINSRFNEAISELITGKEKLINLGITDTLFSILNIASESLDHKKDISKQIDTFIERETALHLRRTEMLNNSLNEKIINMVKGNLTHDGIYEVMDNLKLGAGVDAKFDLVIIELEKKIKEDLIELRELDKNHRLDREDKDNRGLLERQFTKVRRDLTILNRIAGVYGVSKNRDSAPRNSVLGAQRELLGESESTPSEYEKMTIRQISNALAELDRQFSETVENSMPGVIDDIKRESTMKDVGSVHTIYNRMEENNSFKGGAGPFDEKADTSKLCQDKVWPSVKEFAKETSEKVIALCNLDVNEQDDGKRVSERKGFKIQAINGDGNCGWYSMAEYIYSNKDNNHWIESIKTNNAEFSSIVVDIISNSKNGRSYLNTTTAEVEDINKQYMQKLANNEDMANPLLKRSITFNIDLITRLRTLVRSLNNRDDMKSNKDQFMTTEDYPVVSFLLNTTLCHYTEKKQGGGDNVPMWNYEYTKKDGDSYKPVKKGGIVSVSVSVSENEIIPFMVVLTGSSLKFDPATQKSMGSKSGHFELVRVDETSAVFNEFSDEKMFRAAYSTKESRESDCDYFKKKFDAAEKIENDGGEKNKYKVFFTGICEPGNSGKFVNYFEKMGFDGMPTFEQFKTKIKEIKLKTYDERTPCEREVYGIFDTSVMKTYYDLYVDLYNNCIPTKDSTSSTDSKDSERSPFPDAAKDNDCTDIPDILAGACSSKGKYVDYFKVLDIKNPRNGAKIL